MAVNRWLLRPLLLGASLALAACSGDEWWEGQLAADPCDLRLDQVVSDALAHPVKGRVLVNDGGPQCRFDGTGSVNVSVSVGKASVEMKQTLREGTGTFGPISPTLGDASGWQPFGGNGNPSGALRAVTGDRICEVVVNASEGNDPLEIARAVAVRCLERVNAVKI